MKKMNLKIDKGFTLVDVLLAPIIVKSEERTCQANQQLIEDGYERDFLFAYNNVTFSTYVIEHNYKQCSSGKGYTYE